MNPEYKREIAAWRCASALRAGFDGKTCIASHCAGVPGQRFGRRQSFDSTPLADGCNVKRTARPNPARAITGRGRAAGGDEMKGLAVLLGGALFAAGTGFADAVEVKTVSIGAAEIVYDYETTESGVAILTLIGIVPEANNSLRGLKNGDPRRLGKLGQLMYQCKLVLYLSDKTPGGVDANDPVLISKNYGLFTGVDISLAADERVGVRVQALQAVDAAAVFSDTLGQQDAPTGVWETVGDGAPLDLKQFNVNLLKENDLIHSSENIEIAIRFPVFQLEKPVNQWVYDFALADFKQAVRRIDEDCAPARLGELVKQNS